MINEFYYTKERLEPLFFYAVFLLFQPEQIIGRYVI